jgi:hypothetical protein
VRIHRRELITYLGAYLIAISVAVRGLSAVHGHPSRWTVVGLLLAFVALLAIEPRLTRRSRGYGHLYLLAQTAIVSSLLITPPWVDLFAVLFLVLSLQAMHVFPVRIGFAWLCAFTLITAALMVYVFGYRSGLPHVLSYTIAYFVVGSFVALLRQAEADRDQSQYLVADQQRGHSER